MAANRRIAVFSASPLLADGLQAALREAPEMAAGFGWRLVPAAEWGEPGEPADAYVIHASDGADALGRYAALPVDRPAVILGHDLRELAVRSAGDARAVALLSPQAQPAQLRLALAAVLAGLTLREAGTAWAAPSGAASLAEAPARQTAADPALDHEPLTPREIEVFELLAKGLSNRDIGGVLGISAHTAKFHVGQILAKVGAATRAEAVSSGLRLGLIGL